jgi:SAM-dependent methyltransferase
MADSQKKVGTSADAFDNVATRYDADSTYIELSVWFRALVWERMERIFKPGMHILELGCGTGEDAVWNAKRGLTVTATDASQAMLEETRRKAISAGVADRVHVVPFDFSKPETWQLEGQFDGVYSNYGALNCIGEFSGLGKYLAAHIKPEGVAGLCLIGRYCPWEILWHGAHLHFRTAFRRLPGKAIAHLEGRYFPVYYPMPGQLARMFGEGWQRGRVDGVGVFIPPSDLYRAVGRRPRLARLLLRLEKATATHWPFRLLGDHYWIELIRK